jgi:hypothetical protein
MNALNEVNKVIAGVSYYPHRHTTGIDPEGEWLTPERMAVRIIVLLLLPYQNIASVYWFHIKIFFLYPFLVIQPFTWLWEIPKLFCKSELHNQMCCVWHVLYRSTEYMYLFNVKLILKIVTLQV